MAGRSTHTGKFMDPQGQIEPRLLIQSDGMWSPGPGTGHADIANADIIAVDGIVIKNRFGRQGCTWDEAIAGRASFRS